VRIDFCITNHIKKSHLLMDFGFPDIFVGLTIIHPSNVVIHRLYRFFLMLSISLGPVLAFTQKQLSFCTCSARADGRTTGLYATSGCWLKLARHNDGGASWIADVPPACTPQVAVGWTELGTTTAVRLELPTFHRRRSCSINSIINRLIWIKINWDKF
jgi:hypothetical protein